MGSNHCTREHFQRPPRARLRASGVLLSSLLLACGSHSATDQRVTDAAVSEDAAGDFGRGECSSHRECVDAHAAHWICRSDHTCVSLLSDACTFVRGDDTRDDAVFVGLLSVRESQLLAVSELVRRDFTAAVGGLPTADSERARPFVLVGCEFEFGGDPVPAARYLVETIGVPAIVGPQGSQGTISVAQNVTIPAGALLVSPSALSDIITGLSDGDLVFRTSPTTRAVAPAFAAMVRDLEHTLLAEGVKPPLKVALVSSRDAYGLALSAALRPLLHFNDGLSADANEALGQFLAVSYDASEEGFADSVAARVVPFAPQIVLSLTGFEVRPFQAIEQGLAKAKTATPYYITDSGSLEHSTYIASQPDELRTHVRTRSADPTRPLSQAYAARIEREFGESPLLLTGGSVYDAASAVAYGIVAAGAVPLTGAAIAHGIRRLVGTGERIEALPTGVERGVEVLLSGQDIDLEGVSGPVDFDRRGDVTADDAVGCYVRDTATGAVSVAFSGQVYRVATGELEGTYHACD